MTQRLLSRSFRATAVVVVLLVALFTTTASAANLRVPTTFSTIQAAVNAAAEGDRIIVQGGGNIIYEEDVVIRKNNIRVIGRSRPKVLGSIRITGDDVVLRFFEVESIFEVHNFSIRMEGNSGRVSNSDVFLPGDDGNAIFILGNENRVEDNRVEGGSNCIQISGDENRVLRNQATGSENGGIDIEGDRNLVQDNTSTRHGLGEAFVIGGVDNAVIDNIATTSFVGFRFSGRGHRVQGNQASNSEEGGFQVDADFCQFNNDNEAQFNLFGFHVSGDSNVLEGNSATDNVSDGWLILGDNNQIRDNESNKNGGLGMESPSGSGNRFSDNSCSNNSLGDSVPRGLCD